MNRLTRVALWIVSGLLALVMVGSGIEKFTGPTWERMFRAWGYPEGFYLVIGAIEVVGGIGLLIPRAAGYSAPALSVVMIGAAITQMTRGGRSGVGEIVFATLLAIIAFARRPAFARSKNDRGSEGKPDLQSVAR